MAPAQAGLARESARPGRQPRVVQADRGACFLGAAGGASAAVPSRLTLWLWGLGIEQRRIPVHTPQRNGAVARCHGGVEHRWAGEAGGLAALPAGWTLDRPPLDAGQRPYGGRAGFDRERVWAKRGPVRVARRVDRQGKLSPWDRPVRVGRRHADRPAAVTFDAARRVAVVRDERAALLAAVTLGWLAADWLWAAVPLTDQAPHPPATSTTR